MGFRENMTEYEIRDIQTGELVATTFGFSGDQVLKGFVVGTGYGMPEGEYGPEQVYGGVDEWTIVYENTELVVGPKDNSMEVS